MTHKTNEYKHLIIWGIAGKTRIRVMSTGISVHSSGDLEIKAEDFFQGTVGQNLELAAERYICLHSGESGILLMPDHVQLSGQDCFMESPQNSVCITLDDESAEYVLGEYERVKSLVPPGVASDGSIIRREGYDDILYSEGDGRWKKS